MKLANIPGPVIGRQTVHRRVRHRGHALPELAGKLREEKHHEQSDVHPALAQGRDSEREDVEPEEEIRAESAGGYRLLQIAIGCGDDANIHGLRAAAAHGLELALLEHTKQLDLCLRRQLAHLVEEDRAAICQLEAADAPLDRAGKRAFHVAEELALDQSGRDGAAVDLDQRALPAAASGMDSARNQLLARAGLAGDEHGRVRGRDLLELAKQRQERWAVADQLGKVVLAVDLFLEIDALALEAGLERCDLLVGLHVFDGQRDLVRDLAEEPGVRLRVLARIDAGDGQDADASAVHDQGNDDVGPHAVGIGLLIGGIVPFCSQVAAQEQLLSLEYPPHVAVVDRHFQADDEVLGGHGGLEDEEAQDIALRVAEEDGRPVEGEDPAQGLGDSVKEGFLGQILHEGIVDLKQRTVTLGLARECRNPCPALWGGVGLGGHDGPFYRRRGPGL